MLEFLLWTVAIVNVVAFLVMGVDKWLAGRARRRVPEGFLLTLALCGGFPAIWIAMSVFRHKTVKRSFQWKLLGVTLLNAVWLIVVYRFGG